MNKLATTSVTETQSFSVKFGEDEDSLCVSFSFPPGKPEEAKISFGNGSPTPTQMQHALQSLCEKYPEAFQ